MNYYTLFNINLVSINIDSYYFKLVVNCECFARN